MSIPDYQALMLPLLQFLADGQPRQAREAYEALSEHFGLSEAERLELLPGGSQPVIENRVGWASFYLRRALLVDALGRGRWCITQRGKDYLSTNPPLLTKAELFQFSEFADFMARPLKTAGSAVSVGDSSKELPPTEAMDVAYLSMREALASELLSTVKSCSPAFFERLVVDLMLAMGYGGSRREAGEATRLSGDGGIDGVIREDRLGLDTIYLQAKRWEGSVGRPEIQKFAGALQGERARKGVFITTSSFSREARDYVERLESRIVLIDGWRLAELMIDFNVGVATRQRYDIKQLDSDYFEGA